MRLLTISAKVFIVRTQKSISEKVPAAVSAGILIRTKRAWLKTAFPYFKYSKNHMAVLSFIPA